MHKEYGRTLIEMVVVISIIAILSIVATPSFIQQIKTDRLVTTANQLHSVYKFARSEAIKRDAQIDIIAQAGEWLVQLGGETISMFQTNNSAIQVSGLANLTISATGSTTAGSYLVTDSDAETTDLRLCIFVSGQSVLTSASICP